MSCTFVFSKNDFNPSRETSKLSYTLKGLLSHFEISTLFLSSRKRSSNSTIIFTPIMKEKPVGGMELMVKEQCQINLIKNILHYKDRGNSEGKNKLILNQKGSW